VLSCLPLHEKGLGPWMLGEQFAPADVSLFCLLTGMPDRYAGIVNGEKSPVVMAWYRHMTECPAVKEVLPMPSGPGNPQEGGREKH
jgi:glutathione S-transferase